MLVEVPFIVKHIYDHLREHYPVPLASRTAFGMALAQAQPRPGCNFVKAAKKAVDSPVGKFVELYEDGTADTTNSIDWFNLCTMVVLPGSVLAGCLWSFSTEWEAGDVTGTTLFNLVCLKDIIGIPCGTAVDVTFDIYKERATFYVPSTSTVLGQTKLSFSVTDERAC